jgi:hypothetical protein
MELWQHRSRALGRTGSAEDQNDLRAQHIKPDPLVSVAVVSPKAPHVPTLPDAAICLAGFPGEAVAVVGGEGINWSSAMDAVSLSDGQ